MNLCLVLQQYNIDPQTAFVQPFGSGLINHTWKVTSGNSVFILQKINTAVFENPEGIARNIRLLADYLAQHHPHYPFVAPLPTSKGLDLFITSDGFFRLFPFVPGSHTIDAVQTPEQAFEASVQFGRFSRLLALFDAPQLVTTIPHFHNLSLRYHQFLNALENAQPHRLAAAAALVKQLQHQESIVAQYEAISKNPAFKRRVMHHDTKISNVLFDESGKGICVIDLDTVMPGYFISDVGDMMRTYLSPATEEEQVDAKIEIRADFYRAIKDGYLQEMGSVLAGEERAAFFYAGKFMIYMQALRFLTDYLNGDVYYGERYPGHNLVRARNQTVLLERLVEKKTALSQF